MCVCVCVCVCVCFGFCVCVCVVVVFRFALAASRRRNRIQYCYSLLQWRSLVLLLLTSLTAFYGTSRHALFAPLRIISPFVFRTEGNLKDSGPFLSLTPPSGTLSLSLCSMLTFYLPSSQSSKLTFSFLFFRRSCWDSNPQSFNHESVAGPLSCPRNPSLSQRHANSTSRSEKQEKQILRTAACP